MVQEYRRLSYINRITVEFKVQRLIARLHTARILIESQWNLK